MTPRAGIRLSDSQRIDWLRLCRSDGVGPRTFQGLVNRFGGARNALDNLPELARSRGRAVRIATLAEAEAEMKQAARIGVRLVALGEEDYPQRLLDIPGPPPILAVLGQSEFLHHRGVGIVGARNASAAGRKIAAQLASGLGRGGYVVISGLARGIDAEAHRAALDQGTVAVLAGGLDRPYPPDNRALFDEIVERGAAISEMPLGLSPRGRDFPRRNRLISGLSLGVVVVEAARRSGSLITARMANEQGREVFAIPGSPLDPRCEGTNDLLREGASIAISAEDILAALAPLAGDAARMPMLFREPETAGSAGLFDELDEVSADAHEAEGEGEEHLPPGEGKLGLRLLALLSIDPVEIDMLARMSAAQARDVQSALMDLELSGLITRHPGNRVSRRV